MKWLIKADVLDEVLHLGAIGAMPSPDKVRALVERDLAARTEPEADPEPEAALDRPRILTVAGSEAEIVVEGPLVRKRLGYYYFYDRSTTSYQEIEAALAVADKDPAVRRVTMRINSPGGEVDGLFDAVAAIEAFTKPIVARVSNAHSAAYTLAAMCNRIEAMGPASMFGSVGVAVRYSRWTDQEIIDITNTDSPDKRPDPTTDEGKAVIRRELDAIQDLVVDAIARGRTAAGKSIKAAEVSAAFGAGASFTAAEARRRKMIDSVGKVGRPSSRPDPGTVPLDDDFDASANEEHAPAAAGATTASGGEETEIMTEPKLTLARLKAEYPEIYQAAKDDGVTEERDRVESHLVLGEATGEDGMKIALEAAKTGKALTGAMQAKYMAAGLRKNDRDDRQEETDAAAAATQGATVAGASAEGAGEPDEGDQVCAHNGWNGKPQDSEAQVF